MREHDVTALTARELDHSRRELAASLALARPDSPARAPILAHLDRHRRRADPGEPASSLTARQAPAYQSPGRRARGPSRWFEYAPMHSATPWRYMCPEYLSPKECYYIQRLYR